MSKVHKIAGLRISRVAGRALLPDLEPPEARLKKAKSQIFSADSIRLSHASAMEDVFDPVLREEHDDTIARTTVYVMNMIVLLFSVPVGAALMLMNIIGGENLRTTAHAVALTGLFTALAQTGALA